MSMGKIAAGVGPASRKLRGWSTYARHNGLTNEHGGLAESESLEG